MCRVTARWHDERGVALVLTLIIVALVSVLVLEYHFEAVVELDLADNYGSDVQAYHVAMSGVRLAQELLAHDDNQSDGPQNDWHRIGLIPACMPPQTFLMLAMADSAGASLGTGLAGQQGMASDAAAAQGPDKGCISLNIAVEEERLPLNALVPVVLPDDAGEPLTTEAASMLEDWEVVFETLFIRLDIDSVLFDALTGWLEDNGPLRTVRELSLVPGFDAEAVNKLAPFVTAYGRPIEGDPLVYPKVNVNTANREVLHALIDGLADGAGDVSGYVDDIMARREDDLLEGRQFESVSELQDDLPTEVQVVFDKFATVQGAYFTITSVGRVEDIQKTVVAVLKPGDGNEPIYFKVE